MGSGGRGAGRPTRGQGASGSSQSTALGGPSGRASGKSFAEQIKDAVDSIPKDQGFGDRKVFVSDVWDKVRDTIGMSESQFKDALVQANRADTVALSRADLTAAMSHEKVDRSVIEHGSQRYHLIQRR